MKKLIPFIFILFLAVSCEDILKEEPKSIAMEYFYNTPGEAETAVAAIFPPIRSYNGFGFLYPAQLNTYAGDYYTGRGSYAPLSDFQGLNTTNITRIQSMWIQFYLGIRNANLVISNVPNGTNMTDDQKALYIGQARFMRAFIYYHMIINWGKLVLRTEENMTEQNVPVSPANEVFELIVEDLQYAETNLPDAPKYAGLPSKWAAKTFLSDVYFSRGQYSEAANKAKEVIDSKKYSLVEITQVDDFNKIYGPTVVTTPEEIFYLKYSRESGQGWSEVTFFHHPDDPYDYGKAGLFAHYMADSTTCGFYQSQPRSDLRRKLWYHWNIGWGPRTMLSRKFYDNQTLTGAGNDYPFYRFADVLLIYAEASSRVSNGPTADAMEKLNMVKRRAYGKPSTTPSDIDYNLADYPTLESFLDLLLKERGRETVDEAKRWADLKRLGRAKEIIGAATGKTVADKHFWWPIPVGEMDFNSAIDPVKDQNPGY